MNKQKNSLKLPAPVAISAIVLGLALASPAAAAVQVEFKNVTGAWFDPVGGTNVNISPNGGDGTIRWGVSTGYGQSGYNFIGTDFSTVLNQDIDSSGAVNIGEFQHLNFPISTGGAITNVGLKFTTDVWADDNFLGTKTFEYNFSHFETPNQDNSCANGLPNNAGVNSAGCADRVTMNFNSNSQVFDIGGKQYTLNLDGFLVDGSPSGGFWTQEQALNSAFIRGKVDLYSVASAVPEPGTWAMMIIGFGSVGTMVRSARRRQALAV
ncbi:THxN family PEP-CTERM protein [Phenylobacterium sp.]|uniref:THxN family PEP-CTERM protein n=1 Tax=Phenylobacterium sp. TaxID=1871053 RepID=UPI00289CB911|nr:THxN family PEP-CTERM protein [Phenylobacterium sp.]